MMGAHKLGFSKAEKYCGDRDQYSQEGTSASITETLHKREKGLTDKLNEMM